MKRLIKKLINAIGYDIVPRRWAENPEFKNKGFEREFMPLYEKCMDYTMTSQEKMFALYRAVKYLNINGIRGEMVECGVASGGSMMLAALTSINDGSTDRELYLFDTFSGMPAPTGRDVNYRGDKAQLVWEPMQREDHNEWCYESLANVQKNMACTNYPSEKLHYIKGLVEDTLPVQAPEKIALLRLDTDWYASTKHELENLYPRLCEGGVLIIDDYGQWEGCKQATDEYFDNANYPRPLFHRIDRLGIICVKPTPC
jgi:hypothetical protein